jgi:hypothetical protein
MTKNNAASKRRRSPHTFRQVTAPRPGMTRQTDRLMPFLTPFLTAAGIPDPDLARQAAKETIQSYKATTRDQLVTTAPIIAFASTSLKR